MRVHDGRQEDEVVRAAADVLGHAQQPWQRTRRLDHRHAAVLAEGVLALERDDEVQALVQHAWKRMRRVETNGRRDRQQLLLEVALYPGAGLRVPVGALEKADALTRQRGQQILVQQAVLVGLQLVRRDADARELVGRAEAVGAGLDRAELDLVDETCNPHLEELIQVGAADAQKTQPLEQRHLQIAGLLQHAAVKGQQRHLAVQVEIVMLERGWGRRKRPRLGARVDFLAFD